MSQKEYANNGELIQDLIDADRDNYNPEGYINISNFSGAFYKGEDIDLSRFWYSLLERLADPTKGPILTPEFKDEEGHPEWASVFSFINDKADLDDETVWDKVTHDPENPNRLYSDFWNDSLRNLINYFITHLTNQNGEIDLGNGVTISISDIKNADAAYDFNNFYVRPTSNIDNRTYENVRGADAIQSVLKNSSELQFTRDGMANYWTRLIMPKYLRKVEVEDLNRNFWVIAQTLSAVTAFLFGDDSIKKQFEGILKELVGLWENVLYLWALGAMISQKDTITDFQTIFVPLTNSELYDYRKFDDFGDTAPTGTDTSYINSIKSRLQYIIRQYPETNLIIIPEVRHDNYKHNYYSRVDYPGLLTYDRNTGKQVWANFVVDQAYQVQNRPYLSIDLGDDLNSSNKFWCQRIGAIKEEEVYYQYQQPFSSVGITSPYYAAIRTKLLDMFSSQIDYDSSTHDIRIGIISFRFFDAMHEAIDGQQHLLGIFSHSGSWWSSEDDGDNSNILLTASDISSALPSSVQADITIERGYYLGELVSCQSVLGTSQVRFNAQAYQGQQLFKSTPEDIIGMIQGADA